MNDLFVFPELLDEFLDPLFVKEAFLLVFTALVSEKNFNSRIQKGQFTQAIGQNVELEFRRDGKNGRVRLERDERPSALGLADDAQLVSGDAAGKGHMIDVAIPGDLNFEPVRQSIDALGPHAVQSP